MVSSRTQSPRPRDASNLRHNGYVLVLDGISSTRTDRVQYGLQSAFSEIERLSHEVTGNGNPITMNLSTRYKVKGVGIEKQIDSVITIKHDAQGKIELVEDKWDGKLPDSAFANVSTVDLHTFLSKVVCSQAFTDVSSGLPPS